MVKILIIEDEKHVRANLVELLLAEGYEAFDAENGQLGVEKAKQVMPDLIICDVMMPELDGYGVLATLRNDAITDTIPFLFLTAKASKADFRQGMSLGAEDYLTKPFTRIEVLDAIRTQLSKQQTRKQKYQAEIKEEMDRLLLFDNLTGLPNSRQMYSLFRDAVANLTDADTLSLPVLVLSIERLNEINSSLGQEASDTIVRTVVERLKDLLDQRYILARVDNDKFAVLFSSLSQPKDFMEEFSAIIAETAFKPCQLKDQEVYINTNIGFAFYPEDGDDFDIVLRRAEEALLEARKLGSNRSQFYSPFIHNKSLESLKLEASMHRALERNEFEVYFQPQINLKTGKIVGAEALIRWVHPEEGIISPIKFIPIAEDTGLIIPLGDFIFRESCMRAKEWCDKYSANFRIAVNISARQFSDPLLSQKIRATLNESSLNPHNLELELTETILVKDFGTVSRTLNELKTLGIMLAIDDFGTGYSSLSYLRQLPFDILKIDRSFVIHISQDLEAQSIAKSIIQLGHNLGLKIIAEGVENESEARFLSQQNCDEMQGYLFSRPVTALAFEILLKTEKTLTLSD
ncbi:EAL domain-containing protein [Candidatus Chlorohelix sp.]|uniref:two-component system response regulator n=1 Tax=Candidatus Chlorohelix sp. TaxID=3139201 RepID=UPI0030257244